MEGKDERDDERDLGRVDAHERERGRMRENGKCQYESRWFKSSLRKHITKIVLGTPIYHERQSRNF